MQSLESDSNLGPVWKRSFRNRQKNCSRKSHTDMLRWENPRNHFRRKITLRSLFPLKEKFSIQNVTQFDTGTENCGSMTVSDRILSWLDICEKKKTIPLPGGAEIRKPFIRRYCRSSISTRSWVMYHNRRLAMAVDTG